MWRAVILLMVWALPALAQDRAAVEAQFKDWLEQVVWPQAEARGVERAIYDAALGDVVLDWDVPSLILPEGFEQPKQDTKQAEFRAPVRYFRPDNVIASARIGRDKGRKLDQALGSIEARYGVPRHILLAIWGRESGFGAVPIRDNPFPVLATRGFMGRNADYFTGEVVALLQIAQEGHVPLADIRSSWAGALGQPQFMPSSYLAYAADGDRDGKRDIWGSAEDTLASIASFLNFHEWDRDRDWGFEVSLPDDLSCTQEGPDQRRRVSQWIDAGVRRANGRDFPEAERNKPASLMLPAGRNGPAFLVTPNFYVIKRYNPSDLYALFVGHVGDRIAYDVGDFVGSWGVVDGMKRGEVAAMQEALIALGHDVGGADGLAGFKTRRSIGRWQEGQGQAATCFPDAQVVRDLAR